MSVVVLSSSPPPTFARSPTPITSSSPTLPSPAAIFRNEILKTKIFKTTTKTRDGFLGVRSGARLLLSPKRGVENIPVRSPGRERFKLPTSSLDHEHRNSTVVLEGNLDAASKVLGCSDGGCTSLGTNKSCEAATSNVMCISATDKPLEAGFFDAGAPKPLFAALPDNQGNPQPLDKAIPRRTDWTPLKESCFEHGDGSDLVDRKRSFHNDLFGSFGFESSNAPEPVLYQADSCQPTKRRKVELVEAPKSRTVNHNPRAQAAGLATGTKPCTAKRKKVSAKKPLTITGLATSHYAGNDESYKSAPIVELLNVAPAQDVAEARIPPSKGHRNKSAIKKSFQATKKAPKPKLLSPQSALKVIEQQEALFGSASQLAREESPTLVRDTLEALKRSELSLLSDPVSTQQTQPYSVESTTPRAARGTTRFVKTRKLWGAAGRDEDNALLHVDTVDLCDTPGVRLAFAGKDVLLEPGRFHAVTADYAYTETPYNGGWASSPPSITAPGEFIYNVDEMMTPQVTRKPSISSNMFVRAYHSSTVSKATLTVKPMASDAHHDPESLGGADVKTDRAGSGQSLAKPSYAGFSTHELQKQISAYGFKPVKKREKMVELLDRCWEEKHSSLLDMPIEGPVESVKHGDFVSKVYGAAARPQPKVKKPGKPASVTKNKKAPAEPKTRKKVELKAKDPKTSTKTPRKRKNKASITEEVVVDVDNVIGGTSTPFGDAKTGESIEADSIIIHVPQVPISEMIKPEASAVALRGGAGDHSTDVGAQIQAAILYESQNAGSERDHVNNPTWHEKILIYDPIILEDLTAWLNTEGFGLINDDREVGALEVRTWCESNGICCLWRGGWRGQKTKNGDD